MNLESLRNSLVYTKWMIYNFDFTFLPWLWFCHRRIVQISWLVIMKRWEKIAVFTIAQWMETNVRVIIFSKIKNTHPLVALTIRRHPVYKREQTKHERKIDLVAQHLCFLLSRATGRLTHLPPISKKTSKTSHLLFGKG